MEREQHYLANDVAEAMYKLLEMEGHREEPHLDQMMRRLQDLSAYSLTHAEIMDQREGVELLALAKFFGATSDPGFHKNQERLRLLSEETVGYQGRAEVIEEEVANRKTGRSSKLEDDNTKPKQMRLL